MQSEVAAQLRDAPRSLLPPGFVYQPEVVSEGEERALLDRVASLPFEPVEFRGFTARRRAVHFGVGYDFERRDVTEAPHIPCFLLPLREKAATLACEPPASFTEALVMEYTPGSVIGWHRDAAKFGPIVLGVSLGSAARMRFRKPPHNQRASIILKPRSVYVLSGDARAVWQHSIPALEELRYSITFRSVR